MTTGQHIAQNVAVLTTSRSEYYQIRTVLRHIQRSPNLSLQLFVSGTHLSSKFGRSEQHIIADGFTPVERLPILVDEDSGFGSALTAGLAVQMIAGALQRQSTDLLLLAGDRYETLAAALAATCMGVPIAHMHGGERTEGALDDACRHAITKLSAVHFTSTDVYRARVIQMGEPPDRVFTTGAPLLDEVMQTTLLTERELEERLDFALIHPVALVAYHPATREHIDEGRACLDILTSVADCKTLILTAPNSDPGHESILQALQAYPTKHPHARLFANLGSQNFLSVMAHADLMIGNSSSGIHEAASFRLPVVNVGSRQAGRLRPRNVIDCAADYESIRSAVAKALSADFRRTLENLQNPYGDGHAGERIAAYLEKFAPFKESLLQKSFYDSPDVQAATHTWMDIP